MSVSPAPSVTAEPQSSAPRSAVIPVFIGLMVAMLASSLGQMIFATALPTIVGELDGVENMLWVTTAYLLGATIMIPVYGKLGDLIGRKGLFIGAIVIFLIGAIIGGLATSMPLLIAARAIQGIGGGGLMILSQAIIADIVSARERGKYMGMIGGAFAISSVAGPLLGGWLTEGPGWRWGLWLNIPLGLIAIAVAAIFLHPAAQRHARPKLDVAGMVLLAIATASIVLTTSFGGHTYEWGSPQILGLIALAVVSAVAFVVVESRAAEPILPLYLFRNATFNLTTAAGMLTGIGMFGVMAYMPTYLQMVAQVDATEAGLLTAPMMGLMLITSTAIGFVVTRTGRYKWFPIIGSLIIGASLFLLSTLTADTSIWITTGYLALLGMGLGLTMQILVLMVQNAFPLRVVGTATASNNYFRQVGASIGTAAVGSMFTARLIELIGERLPAESAAAAGSTSSFTPSLVHDLPEAVRDIVVGAYNDALTPTFLLLMPLALLGAVLLLFVKETPLRTTIAKDEPAPVEEAALVEAVADAAPAPVAAAR